MADKPSFTGPNKPTPDEVKQEILKKLEEIDLGSITSLSGGSEGDPDAERMDWSRVVWTVWNR